MIRERAELFKRVCSEFFIEAFYPTAALYGLLFAGIERMALRADIDFQRIDVLGRAHHVFSAASASNFHNFVCGLNIFLHFYTSFVFFRFIL